MSGVEFTCPSCGRSITVMCGSWLGGVCGACSLTKQTKEFATLDELLAAGYEPTGAYTKQGEVVISHEGIKDKEATR